MSTPYIEIPSAEELFNESQENQEQSKRIITITAPNGVIDKDSGGYIISKDTNGTGIIVTLDDTGEDIEGYNWARKPVGGSWESLTTQDAPENSTQPFGFDTSQGTEWQIRGRTYGLEDVENGQAWYTINEEIIEIRIVPEFPELVPILSPFTAKIIDVSNNRLTLNTNFNTIKNKIAKEFIQPEPSMIIQLLNMFIGK